MMSFLDDFREAMESERQLTPDRVCEILSERWGGERVYIPTKKGRITIRQSDTVQTLMARGVKRSTAYNWVNRYKSR